MMKFEVLPIERATKGLLTSFSHIGKLEKKSKGFAMVFCFVPGLLIVFTTFSEN